MFALYCTAVYSPVADFVSDAATMDAEVSSTVTVKIDSSIVSDVIASVGDDRRKIEQVLWGSGSNLKCWREGEAWYISGCCNNVVEAEANLRTLFEQPIAKGRENTLVSNNETKSAVNLTQCRTKSERTASGSGQKNTTEETGKNQDGAVGGAKPETGKLTFKLLLFRRIYCISVHFEN